MEQGSPEWHAARCGKVTASRVADIVRQVKSGGASAMRERYMGELIAERLTGVPAEGFASAEMERGNALEADAVAAYAFYGGVDCQTVGFVDHPAIPMAGASPDRLVGDVGLVEVKCPATHTHIETLLSGRVKPDYVIQMQWQLACTGRAWCDFVSFDPRLPEAMRMFVHRVPRDETEIRRLQIAVTAFQAELEDRLSQLRQRFQEAAE
jgi:putative phage-type endonuclease